MEKRKTSEEFNKVITFFMSLLVLASLTVAFGFVWIEINKDIIWAFDTKGNYLIIVLYFVMQYLFSRIYGALKIGFYKVSNIVYSQMLTTAIVDFLMYIVMSLVARHLISIAPMIKLILVQLFIVVAWAYVGTFVYKRLYPPYRLVVIYGNKSATNLVRKMSVRDDQFQICEAIKLEEGMERIESRIKFYDGAIICDIPGSERNDILKCCFDNDKRAYVTPKISDILIRGGENIHLFDTPLLLCKSSGLTYEQRVVKRAIDIIVSLVGLIVMAIPMLITAIAIKLQDGGPVFFKQDRITRNGKVFKIIKFRSMKVDADADRDGKAHSATVDDDRITPVGRVIRACRMDEFPQIFNILKGEMSVVGPRPECVENVEQYTAQIPEFNYRHKVKAGLTGYAQIYGKYNTTAYDKLKLDLYYIENYSIRTDLRLILMTVKVLFMRESTEGFEET
ncbi:MAG: sugar transferase [Oscillospiraceae bacterium]|nr:sugar transferase [Oscillospiraceae bacterium]